MSTPRLSLGKLFLLYIVKNELTPSYPPKTPIAILHRIPEQYNMRLR